MCVDLFSIQFENAIKFYSIRSLEMQLFNKYYI